MSTSLVIRPCVDPDCPDTQILADDPFLDKPVWWCRKCLRIDDKGAVA